MHDGTGVEVSLTAGLARQPQDPLLDHDERLYPGGGVVRQLYLGGDREVGAVGIGLADRKDKALGVPVLVVHDS